MRKSAPSLLTAMALLVGPASAARAQEAPPTGDAEAGQIIALTACTGCHVVSPDQPFAPVYTGSPSPPDFDAIALTPRTTADSLRHILVTVPTRPPPHRMADTQLTKIQIEDVVAFIMALRNGR